MDFTNFNLLDSQNGNVSRGRKNSEADETTQLFRAILKLSPLLLLSVWQMVFLANGRCRGEEKLLPL